VIPLADWIPAHTKGYAAPLHLAPLTTLLDRALIEPIQAVVHAPPRHAKTETILGAIARALEHDPSRTHAYTTYEANLAKSKSRKVRDLARSSGVQVRDDAGALHEWRTKQGGGLLATGVMGPLTGQGVSGLLVVDDPFKNRVEAESGTRRRTVLEWFRDVAYTRREPGCSVIVVMTRWHPDDLAGELIRGGWEFLRLPAISDSGEALWPERWPLGELEKIHEQVGEFTWTSLYQGLPRGRGGALFSDVHTYERLPDVGVKTAIGFDLAYSKKTSADYSVGLVMHKVGEFHYVSQVERKQQRAPEFKRTARALVAAHPHARRRWYAYGPEIAVGDLFATRDESGPGVDVGAEKGDGDKFVRAQPVAAAWNAGKVLIPKGAPWVEAFVAEVCGFTGLDDDHDDQVDALAAAFDALNAKVPSFDGVSEEPIRFPTRI
jgi:predicted phage terminase large subunit-like protein